VRPDDTLMVHAGLQSAARVEGRSPIEKLETVLEGLGEAVPDGRLILPTFTYSFTSGKDFDVDATPSTVGAVTERFRLRAGARRSADPIFSVAIRGPVPEAWEERLFAIGDKDCFGPDSVFALLRESGAKLLFFGVGFECCTYVHHVEQRLGVPYRYLKDFRGTVSRGAERRAVTARYFVRDLESDVETNFAPLGGELLRRGAAAEASLPRGPRLFLTTARDMDDIIGDEVARNPDYLLRRGHLAANG